MSSTDDDDFDPNLLGDGETMHVPMRLCDAMQRDLAAARARAPRDLRDSAAYPRPQRGTFAVDAYGGTAGLHQPGPRYPSDQSLFDAVREEAQRARDEYQFWISNQWRDQDNDDDDDGDDELQGRYAAIHSALLEAGGNPSDAREYVENLDPDEVFDRDVAGHLRAFQASYGNSNNQEDAARRLIRDRQRREQCYRQYDAELAQAYKNNR
jgi:hypothetical protein